MRRRKNQMYGNENGLPGLPKTTYVAVGGRKVVPKPPRTQMRPVPPAAPMKTHRVPRPLTLPPGPDPTLSRRVDTLDLRMNSNEQSNRTLLDELMRLQQDLKGNVRKNEIEIHEERDNRSRLEMSVRQFQSRNHEVDDRIRRNEMSTKENRGAVQQLSQHVGTIEKMVSSLQNDQHDKSSGSANKFQEYRKEISRLSLENDQLNKIVKNLREEAHDNGSRIDTLQDELLQVQNNISLQSRLMGEQTKGSKNKGVDKRILDNERANNDAKILHLNATIQELSGRLSSEASKREKIEQDFNNKLNILLRDVSASKSKSEKAQQEYDEKMKDVQLGLAETDKQQIRMEMSNVANELNKKISTNDTKIREDTLNKLNVIEESLVEDTKKRKEKEKDLEEKIDRGMKEMKEKGEHDSANLQTSLDKQVTGNKEKLSHLNKRMAEVEKVVREHKLEQEKLLEAEISERLNSDKILDAKIEDLEDDVQLGFKTLQEQMGTSSNKSSKKSKSSPAAAAVNMDEIVQMQEDNADGIRKQVRTDIGKLEKRVSQLETEVKQKDDVMENRLQTVHNEDREATSIMGDQMQQQMDAIAFKHSKLKKKVDDLEKDVSSAPKDGGGLREETNDSISQVRLELKKEQKQRKEDVEEIQENIKKIVGNSNHSNIPSLAQLNMDVDQTQTGLKKCAESIHVVKTMLGEKVRDEKKVREKQYSILGTDVERLDTKIKDLKARIKISSSGLNDSTYLDDSIS